MASSRWTACGVLVALIAALSAGCEGRTVHTNAFASMREARDGGAVDRGWVPAMIPAGAYELRAAYEPEGPRRWGILNFRPEDADALRTQLSSGEVSLTGVRLSIPPRIEWWPIALRGALQPDVIATTGLRTYSSRDGVFLVAVNWKQGRAYYWTVEQ